MVRFQFLSLLFLALRVDADSGVRSSKRQLGVKEEMDALTQQVRRLRDRILCLEEASYSVDAVNGELLRVACDGTPTSLGVVVGPVGPAGPPGTNGTNGLDGLDGVPGADGLPGVDGASCSAARNLADDGVEITCGADPLVPLSDGADGMDGSNGEGCSVIPNILDGGAFVTCAGETVAITDGAEGPRGPDGAAGADGASCSAARNLADDGAEITCGGDAPVSVKDGDTGPTGPQGPAGADGADGADGAAGADGADGATGPQGPAGMDAEAEAIEDFLGSIYPEVFGTKDKVFFRIDEGMTWQDAVDACRQYPGFDLAKIETQEENDLATQACGAIRNQLCWTGLSDTAVELELAWADGEYVMDASMPASSVDVKYDGRITTNPYPSVSGDYNWTRWFQVQDGDNLPNNNGRDCISIAGESTFRDNQVPFAEHGGCWGWEGCNNVRDPLCSSQ